MSDPAQPNDHAAPGAAPSSAQDEDEINLLDLLIVLAKHKKLVLGLPLAAAVVAGIISLLIPNTYTATARILPPPQQSASTALLGQLGGLAGLASASLGIKNPSDLYVGMLKSRTVTDALIARFDLKKLYDADTLHDVRKELDENLNITSGRDGIIAIEVQDKDAQRSALMANACIEELNRLTQTVALTEAAQRKLFFERQLLAEKGHLANAEIELKRTQEATGLIKLDDQGKAIIENVARLRGQLAVKEVQLTAMRSFATDLNPDLFRIQQELTALRNQLSLAEKENGGKEGGGLFVPTGKVPEAGLDYVRKLRDVKYHETIFELLAKQFELAKLDEAKEGSLVQVLDVAIAPDKKSKPRRLLIILVTFTATLFVAIAGVMFLETLGRIRNDTKKNQRLNLLKQNISWRR